MIKKYISGIIGLFYPVYCLFDGEKPKSGNDFYLCDSCFDSIEFITGPVCRRCGSQLHKNTATDNENMVFFCKKCAKNKNWFRLLRSACVYEGTIKECIHLFKYRKKMSLRKLFSKILYKTYKLYFAQENYDLITAVPMHAFKKFLREFNHAEILACDLARNCKIKFFRKILLRPKAARSQTILTSLERKNNVKDAFKLTKPLEIRDKKILLIDDVATTLSTVNECAKLFMSNGAKFVDILTIARGQ